MQNQKIGPIWTLVFALALAVTFGTVAVSQEKVDEEYQAFAINMSNIAPGTSTVVNMHVTRWSTDEQRSALLTVLMEKGQDEFVKALRKEEEAGWFRSTARAQSRAAFPSVRLHYAHQYEEGGKRHITLVTDRPIGFSEAVHNSRTLDYDVTAIQFAVPADKDSKEKGKGMFVMGMELGYDKKKKTLTIEGYGTEPIRLNEVTRKK